MPADKGKVLVAIETILKGKSATKNFKDSIATKWAAKIDTDEEIEAYVSDRSDVLLEASTEADRRATQATTKAKADAAAAVTGKTDADEGKTPEPELPADTPAWAKALLEQNKTLAAKVDGFEKARTTETLTQRFQKAAKEKGIPEVFLKGRIPQSEDAFEASLTELETDFKPFAEQLKTAGFGGEGIPPVNNPLGGNQGGGKGKVDPDIVAFGKKVNEAATTQIKN